jgi:hypothetical protein
LCRAGGHEPVGMRSEIRLTLVILSNVFRL